MRLTETYLRKIVKEELKKILNESADRQQVAQLIAAMNEIRQNYDSRNMGQKIPPYQSDADMYAIKDFINQNVPSSNIDAYLEELAQILDEQGLQLDFFTDEYSDEYLTSLDLS